MKAILIDDEDLSLRYLERLCLEIRELEVTGCFGNALQALDFLKDNGADLVLTDIDMPGMNGLEAVRKIRQVQPDAAVIFITAFEQYALEAFQAEAVSYLMKPCNAQELSRAVKRAALLLPVRKSRVEIVTFGYFHILIDNIPLRINNSKAVELLALLVDRMGAAVTLEQATDILWEGRPFNDAVKRLYRKATGCLNQLCREKNLHFFVSDRGSSHVVPSEFECDYYRLLKGERAVKALYNGEYMSQFSWAEPTIGKIERMLYQD